MSKRVSGKAGVTSLSVWVCLMFAAPSPGQPAEPADEREGDKQRDRVWPDRVRPGSDEGYERRRYPDDEFIDYDSEPPYDYHERYWRRVARDYKQARFRYYGGSGGGWRYGRPGWSHYGAPYGYGAYGYGYGPDEFDYGYLEGRRDGRRFAEWERSYELGRRSYTDAMSDGLLAFRHGDYSTAARHFVRAARLNQGDPASRIHAAHALVAIGRYHRALPALRRAFQLQPKLAFLALDIRKDYGVKGDFDAQVKELEQAARRARTNPALWLLLGYYHFYSGREADALAALYESAELAPGDFMTEALLDAAETVAPAPQRRATLETVPADEL